MHLFSLFLVASNRIYLKWKFECTRFIFISIHIPCIHIRNFSYAGIHYIAIDAIEIEPTITIAIAMPLPYSNALHSSAYEQAVVVC